MDTKKYKNMTLASPVMRILATLVDVIITGVVTAVVTVPFGLASAFALPALTNLSDPSSLTALAANQGVNFISGILTLVVWVVFFVVLPIYVWKGQTIGKKLLKLRIVNSHGKPADQMDILKRYSIYLGAYVVDLIPGINCISFCAKVLLPFVNLVMLFTDEGRQTLLDKVGQTYVISEE